MKIKIGDKIVNAEDEPIMLIFENDAERKMVANTIGDMISGYKRYCMFPKDTDIDIINYFMIC
jgi:hypothetical protein